VSNPSGHRHNYVCTRLWRRRVAETTEADPRRTWLLVRGREQPVPASPYFPVRVDAVTSSQGGRRHWQPVPRRRFHAHTCERDLCHTHCRFIPKEENSRTLDTGTSQSRTSDTADVRRASRCASKIHCPPGRFWEPAFPGQIHDSSRFIAGHYPWSTPYHKLYPVV